MGFVIIVALQIYALLCLCAIVLAVRYAKKRGKSGIKWGFGAAFIMYNLLFWDWIPTVIAHKYYCATQAGFWVYKSVDQWKAENPGVMEGLVSYNKNPGGYNVNWPSKYELRKDGHEKLIKELINARFNVVVSWQDISKVLPIVRTENTLIDVKKNEVLARYICFGSGNTVKNPVSDPLKFWLNSPHCQGGKEKQVKFGEFYIQFKGAEK